MTWRWRSVRVLVVASLMMVSCSGPSAPEVGVAPTATSTPDPPTMEEVAAAFVDAWEANAWSDMNPLVFDSESSPGMQHQQVWAELRVESTSVSSRAIQVDGLRAVQPLSVSVELEQLGVWEYETTLGLVQVGGRWFVEWAPTTIHPGLLDGRELARRRVWPQRGRIRAWDATPLRVERPVVRVGVQPSLIEDRQELLAALNEILAVDIEVVEASLDADGVQPDWFIPVATVRAEEYPQVAVEVEALDAVIIRNDVDRLAPSDDFARQALGTVGPITAEQLADWGDPYDATRIVGRSGLELVFERQLAGTPSGDVRMVDSAGQLVSVLQTFVGREPLDVVTSLDETIQAAAEAAMAGVPEPAALVAIDAESGQIRAAVSRPTDEFARALAGAYPPGSTFKTVTAASFLASGGSPSATVSCPPEVFVGGARFINAGGFSLGTVSLQSAYAASCNTAFVNVSTQLDAERLADAAARFGFGLDYSVGLNTSGGILPEPVDDAEFAASSIGQGRVTASPLHMASVAAAVSDGWWRQPVLVLEPGGATPASKELDPAVAADLRSMMRAVVTNGTGSAVAGAGGDISGKTGSAEFGEQDPPRTHAWFIGFRDGLAFAVLVEGGGAGGSVAAPIAAEFLAAIDR